MLPRLRSKSVDDKDSLLSSQRRLRGPSKPLPMMPNALQPSFSLILERLSTGLPGRYYTAETSVTHRSLVLSRNLA